MKKCFKAIISLLILLTVLLSTVNVSAAINYWESPTYLLGSLTSGYIAEGKCYNGTQADYVLYGKTTSKKTNISIAVNVAVKYEHKQTGQIIEVWSCSGTSTPPLANTPVSTRSYVPRNDSTIPRNSSKLRARATFVANSYKIEYDGPWTF